MTQSMSPENDDKFISPANLGTAVNSASTHPTYGLYEAIVYIGTSTTGTFAFEVTADGTNWIGAEVKDAAVDLQVTGINQTPTAGKFYRVYLGGYRQFRLRTVTTLGATMAHVINLISSSSAVSIIDVGYRPDQFGSVPVHKDGEYSSAQTGTALWTPASGKKFVVTGFAIATGGTTAGIFTLWQGASGDTTYNAGTDPAIYRGEFAPSATVKPGMVRALPTPYVSTTADHVLRVTTSAALTCYIQVDGYEI